MTPYDAVIVGAGATGLTAAYRLAQAGQRVRVLEARDRVGGRLRTEVHGDLPFEIGGQWVSPDQTALLGLLNELGLSTYPRYRDGDSLYVAADGVARRFTGEDLPVDDATRAEIERLGGLLEALAADMDPDRPWEHPQADLLDSITFAQWLDAQTDNVEARDNIALYLGPAMLTKPVWSFSMLTAILMCSSAGSFEHLVDADFILDRCVTGGLAQVPVTLAQRLGEAVSLDADVTHIDLDHEGAVVTVNGERIRTRQVVLALPPTHVRRIRISPDLPAEHRHAREQQSFGLVIKVQAEYDTPFWRDAGLSGTGFGPYQVAHEVYDNTWFDGSAEAPTGVLVAFVASENADAMLRLPAAERRDAILKSLSTYFGELALHPRTYVESDWQDQELTGGAYATCFEVGSLTRYGGKLREPVGPMWFGSSDCAGQGFGHVDGAVRMGELIAQRIVEGNSS
ncbi:MAG: flavin monoamine oxidase family protein [Aeromicrobium sp.]